MGYSSPRDVGIARPAPARKSPQNASASAWFLASFAGIASSPVNLRRAIPDRPLRATGASSRCPKPNCPVRRRRTYTCWLPCRTTCSLASLSPDNKKPCKNRVFAVLAEREGFEPSIRLLTLYSLSRGAPSATRASLQNSPHCCGAGKDTDQRHQGKGLMFNQCSTASSVGPPATPSPLIRW